MKKEILQILNNATYEELYKMYIYFYGECDNITKEDIIAHFYSYIRIYTKNHRHNINFIIMYYNIMSYITYLKGLSQWKKSPITPHTS